MNAIAITDQHWGIARNGRQVFTIPEDLAFFREKTLGRVVIMGRKTLLALPGGAPLKGRANVILTHGHGEDLPPGCVAADFDSLPTVLAPYPSGDVFVAGGGQVYSLLLPFCNKAYITRVYAGAACDTFFPNLDEKNGWKISGKSEIKSYKNLTYQYITYHRG